MGGKDYKAFIVEGEAREPLIIQNMSVVYFKHSNFKIITLPAGQNIYMLWQKMIKDEFETDLIEVLREESKELETVLNNLTRDDFSEIYLFFDYDGHQKNLREGERDRDIIEEMLLSFDNETENGKLYISYPMVEALRDFELGICGDWKRCYCKIEQFGQYKRTSIGREDHGDFRKYTFDIWHEILNIFAMRVSCLLNAEKMISYEEYEQLITPLSIYQLQKVNLMKSQVFVLSAFPEFLFDYFTIRFWNVCVTRSWKAVDNCEKI